MTIARISTVFYFVGLALIIGSWINIVSSTVGWIGWGLAMLGWGAEFLPGGRRHAGRS
jgi:hypothetical protein